MKMSKKKEAAAKELYEKVMDEVKRCAAEIEHYPATIGILYFDTSDHWGIKVDMLQMLQGEVPTDREHLEQRLDTLGAAMITGMIDRLGDQCKKPTRFIMVAILSPHTIEEIQAEALQGMQNAIDPNDVAIQIVE